jgi:WG containing repeat
MKRINSLLLMLSVATFGFAQAQPSDNPLFNVFVDGKDAFIDATGRIVMSVPFEHVEPFSEGLAMAFDAGRFGYIDTTGKVVIPLRFAIASRFSQGLAAVSIASRTWKWGFIDRTGTMVIEPQFDQAGDFSEGLALVRVGELLRYVDPSGRVAIDLHERRLPDEVNLTDARHFSQGLAAFSAPDTAKWGFIGKSGKAVIPPRFDAVDRFHEGLALVTLDGRHGYIDTTGAMVLEIPNDTSGPFSQGLAAVKVGEKFGYMDIIGYMDIKGTMAIAPRFDDANEFVADRARVKIGKAVGYRQDGQPRHPGALRGGRRLRERTRQSQPGRTLLGVHRSGWACHLAEWRHREGNAVRRVGGPETGRSIRRSARRPALLDRHDRREDMVRPEPGVRRVAELVLRRRGHLRCGWTPLRMDGGSRCLPPVDRASPRERAKAQLRDQHHRLPARPAALIAPPCGTRAPVSASLGFERRNAPDVVACRAAGYRISPSHPRIVSRPRSSSVGGASA